MGCQTGGCWLSPAAHAEVRQEQEAGPHDRKGDRGQEGQGGAVTGASGGWEQDRASGQPQLRSLEDHSGEPQISSSGMTCMYWATVAVLGMARNEGFVGSLHGGCVARAGDH